MRVFAALWLVCFSAAGVGGAAQTIPSGIWVVVRTIDAVDSATAEPGKTFEAALDEPLTVYEDVLAPKGAKALLKIVEVKEAGKIQGKAQLMVALSGVEVGPEMVAVETESVSSESSGKGASTAKKAGVGAAIGAIAGGIFGGGKGAAAGAAVGAGAGTAISMATQGPVVRIPSETQLTFLTR